MGRTEVLLAPKSLDSVTHLPPLILVCLALGGLGVPTRLVGFETNRQSLERQLHRLSLSAERIKNKKPVFFMGSDRKFHLRKEEREKKGSGSNLEKNSLNPL